jgi:hypothetical protein
MQPRTWRASSVVKVALAIAISNTAISNIGSAQNPITFKARLSPVALDTPMLESVAGSGSVTAVLSGAKLTVTGEFQGMKSSATVAQLHAGSVTGVRGPVVFDLTVEKAASGKLSGSFDLTAEQAANLRKGRLYIQIHSEKAPEGNLWGWLLPQGDS